MPLGRAGNSAIRGVGNRMAVKVEKLYRLAGAPVDILAESEGTLGLYAMLARHPHLPVKSVVLLSPIVQPGQLSPAGGSVPGAAPTTPNHPVGGLSPYRPSRDQDLDAMADGSQRDLRSAAELIAAAAAAWRMPDLHPACLGS